MQDMCILRCTAQSAVAGLLLEAMNASGNYDRVSIPGLPPYTIHVPERDAIIAVTTAPAPLFSNQLGAIATEHRLDVVLLRPDAGGHAIAADFALGSLPCTAWVEHGFAVYRDAHSTWLVPELFGPAASVTRDGCVLEIVPPYASLAERSTGIARFAADLARLVPEEA